MRGHHEVVGGGLAMTPLHQLQSHDPAVGGVEEGEDGIDRSMGVVCQR